MDCQSAIELLSERARGRAGPEARADLEAHLSLCEACRQAAADQDAVQALMPLWPDLPEPAVAEGLARTREQLAARATRRRLVPAWPAVAGVALALALTAAVAFAWLSRPGPPRQQATAPRQPTVPPASVTPDAGRELATKVERASASPVEERSPRPSQAEPRGAAVRRGSPGAGETSIQRPPRPVTAVRGPPVVVRRVRPGRPRGSSPPRQQAASTPAAVNGPRPPADLSQFFALGLPSGGQDERSAQLEAATLAGSGGGGPSPVALSPSEAAASRIYAAEGQPELVPEPTGAPGLPAVPATVPTGEGEV